MDYLIFAISLAGLMYAADILVKGALGIASNFGLSKGFVGLTLVSAGTSLPEFFVSLVAALEQKPDITVGNVVGSNIFNIMAILGPTAMIFPLAIRSLSVKLEWPVMFVMTFLFYLFSRDGSLDRLEAAFFAASFILFLYYTFKSSKEEVAEQADNTDKQSNTIINVLLAVAGGTGLAIGSKYMVDSAVNIAQAWNISERIIALTIISAGTSAPELITNLVAAFKKETDIAVGNIIGSNIFNILFIIGFSGIILPIPVSTQLISFDFIICIITSLIIFPFMITGGKISRIEGAVLTAGYIAYVVFLIYFR